MKDKYILTISAILTFIFFYLIDTTSLFTADDYVYAFDNSRGYSPINSLYDAVLSQISDYQVWSGRFFVHSIVQYFCGVLGNEIFRICNSLIFMILCIGIYKLIKIRNAIFYWIIPLLLIVLLPIPGSTLWGPIAFCVNYLWPSCCVIWFLYILSKDNLNIKGFKLLIFIPFAFVTGFMQESFSIGICASLLLFLFKNKKEKNKIIISLSFMLGCFLLIIAPGNFVRFAQTSSENLNILNKIITNFAHVLLDSKTIIPTVIIFILLSFSRKAFFNSFILKNYIYIVACIVNCLFIILISYSGERQLMSIDLFNIILLIKLVQKCLFYNNLKLKNNIIRFLPFIFFLIILIPIYIVRNIVKNGHDELILSARNSKDNTAIGTKYEKYCSSSNWFQDAYVFKHFYTDDFYKTGLSLYITEGEDINKIQNILPQEKSYIISNCNSSTMMRNNIYYIEEFNFFVLKLDINNECYKSAIISTESNILGNLKNRILHNKKYYNYYLSIEKCDSFTDDNYKYVIIRQTPPLKIVDINLK